MEKRLLLFLFLTFGIIYVYYQVFPPPTPSKHSAHETPAHTTGKSGEKETPAPPATGTGRPAPAPKKKTTPAPVKAHGPLVPLAQADEGKVFVFDTPVVRWEVDTYGGSVRTAYLKKYARLPEQNLEKPSSWYPVLMDETSPSVFGGLPAPYRTRSLTLDVLDGKGKVAIDLTHVLWRLEKKDADGVVFRLPVPKAGVVFEKKVTFPSSVKGLKKGAYHADLDLSLRVTDAAKAALYGAKEWRIRLTGPGGVPIKHESHKTPGNVANALLKDMGSPKELSGPKKLGDSPQLFSEGDARDSGHLLEWAAVKSRFFASIIEPEDPGRLKATEVAVIAVPDLSSTGKPQKNLSVALDFDLPLPAGNSSVTRKFILYAGPIDPGVFDAPAYSTFSPILSYVELIDWGFIAKPLVFLLGVLHSVLLNWGVAIIVLTLLIRLALFPLSRRQQLSMQRYQKQMSRMKPKMDALKERYAKNKKKLNEETMKLYREEGIHFPLGCLVMFLQMPIFFALFVMLENTIALRYSSFLWAKDLTAPDRLFYICRTNLPLVPDPLYLNLFPILMAVTWWLSTALTPKPTDPQQQASAKMMQLMPIFFSLLLYTYPAGLALYMVASSTWSIFEMKVVKKLLVKEEQLALAPAGFRKGR